MYATISPVEESLISIMSLYANTPSAAVTMWVPAQSSEFSGRIMDSIRPNILVDMSLSFTVSVEPCKNILSSGDRVSMISSCFTLEVET